MSIFINTYKVTLVSRFLPVSWCYRMINNVLVSLVQSQNCECLKDNGTQDISHSLVEVAQRPGRNTFPTSFQNPHNALFPPESLLLSPWYRGLFLLSGTMMSEQESTVHIPLQDRHNFGGPAQSENAGPSSNIIMNFKMGPSRGPSKL